MWTFRTKRIDAMIDPKFAVTEPSNAKIQCMQSEYYPTWIPYVAIIILGLSFRFFPFSSGKGLQSALALTGMAEDK